MGKPLIKWGGGREGGSIAACRMPPASFFSSPSFPLFHSFSRIAPSEKWKKAAEKRRETPGGSDGRSWWWQGGGKVVPFLPYIGRGEGKRVVAVVALLLLRRRRCETATNETRPLPPPSTTREGTPFSLFPSRTLLAIPSLLPLPESLSPLWNGVVCGWRRRRVSQQRPSVAIRSSRGERHGLLSGEEEGKEGAVSPSVSPPSLLLLTLVSSVSVSVGRRRRWPRAKRGASLCRVRSVRLFRVTVPAKVS